jgi:hypothetical protein
MAETPITRRGSLIKAGGLLAATLGAAGCASESTKDSGSTADAFTGPAGVASGAVSCVLAPEQTQARQPRRARHAELGPMRSTGTAAGAPTLAVRKNGSGYVGTIAMGVQRA